MFTKKTLCLFEVDLTAAALPSCEARLAVDYRQLDAAAWAEQTHVDHVTDRYLFQSRFERGEYVWTAHDDTNKIVSYCWVTRKAVEIGEIARVINPRADEIYLYDAFTFAEYRGQNLYPAVMQRILEHSREAGTSARLDIRDERQRGLHSRRPQGGLSRVSARHLLQRHRFYSLFVPAVPQPRRRGRPASGLTDSRAAAGDAAWRSAFLLVRTPSCMLTF